MKKTVKLEGLDCANCAMKIEQAIKEISGVEEASVNFMTTKLKVSAERAQMPRILDEVIATVQNLEPDVVVMKA
ncbi:heavy metal transporter [Vagococcus entomophilus]|uniref:Heavy metal transporter n=1 Tax=Vagococcus entomophilus TaxID=1160095 RepID=A0A430AK17_9ENTE|nr:cation transporter [Vagococcus entomophilus]RSU08353.1 heavy metal transporter [Vagococcus entomophilus]